jgi:hypothetical protein
MGPIPNYFFADLIALLTVSFVVVAVEVTAFRATAFDGTRIPDFNSICPTTACE